MAFKCELCYCTRKQYKGKHMNKKDEMCFLKTRLVRLASEEWKKSVEEIIDIFDKNGVLGYITENYEIFHIEGDSAILDDIKKYLHSRGAIIND